MSAIRTITTVLIALTLQACGVTYHYEHIPVNGERCVLDIYSTRELQGAGLNVGEDCKLSGSADSMTFNEKAIEALSELIGKIP